MSGLLMGHAFYFDLEPRQKLLLLAIADHANDDGYGAYPGQGRLAEKAGCSERHVRRLLTILENSNLLEVVQQGDGRGHTTHYYLPWANDFNERGTRRTSKQEKADTQMSYKPSIEPSEDSEPPRQSEIDSSAPPPASAQTLVSAFYAAPANKKVGALIELAADLGIGRSGFAAALIRDYGSGGDIIDALFEAVKMARGDPWEYMRKVLQNGVQVSGRRDQPLSADRRASSPGELFQEKHTAITEEEAYRAIREREASAGAASEGGGRPGPPTPPEAKEPVRGR